MTDESDGITEAFEGQLRVLVTAAGQVGQQIARRREEELRRAQAADERTAREMQSRFEAERRAAIAELGNVHRAQWWDGATPAQMAHAYELATSWAQYEPEAVRAQQRIVDELKTRHGLSPDELRAQVQHERGAAEREPTFQVWEFRNEADTHRQISKTEALAEIDRLPADTRMDVGDRGGIHDVKGWVGQDPDVDRAIAAKFPQLLSEEQRATIENERARDEKAAARRDETDAAQLMHQATLDEARADEARAAAEHEPDPEDRVQAAAEAERHEAAAAQGRGDGAMAYDSAERRAATARDLEAKGIDHETVATRMRGDVSQAKPATAAVGERTKSNAPKARRARGRGPQAQVAERAR
ncbi:hypothetical protein AAG589_21095 [Isoptericola sp. F-RaC21]|uniref:hypothetical protein n=1 Tax=Isoptericola sp. F-RaC21 TaxID=3141452 RepID=UPI00315B98A7